MKFQFKIDIAVDTIIWLTVAFILTLVPLSCAKKAYAGEKVKYKIALIDTGYDPNLPEAGPVKLNLCKYGHVNFNNGNHRRPKFTSAHGSMVGGILARELQGLDYCVIVYTIGIYDNVEQINTALYKASYEGVVAINASYYAKITSVAEREAFKDAAKRVPAIFVAAGNDGLNLDYECIAFPTCFDIAGVRTIGGLDDNGKRLSLSNYGSKVKEWYSGTLAGTKGTSFAVPRALAAYVRSLQK